MALSETPTKLPLDRWARLMGLNPLHFNSVQVRNPTVCNATWFQYEWQSADRVSREEVARAIAQAESDIEKTLGYRLLPTFEVDEWRYTERAPRPELLRVTPTDVRGFAETVKAKHGYIISGGLKGKTLIETARTITWTDVDGDGYSETGTVTADVVTGQLPCEVRAFYPGVAGDDQYEIRPIKVTIVGLIATITFRREQCVLISLETQDVIPAGDDFFRPVDGTDDTKFLGTIDVYRVFIDPTQQATMMWEPFGVPWSLFALPLGSSGCGDCSGTGCATCAYAFQSACLTIRGDPRLGYLGYKPATWDVPTQTFVFAGCSMPRQPDLVRIWYYGGWQDTSLQCPTVQMDRNWERAVAYYAASLLDRPVCECSNVHAYIERWRRNLADQSEPGESNNLRISARDLDCPFGTRAGAVFAWKQCLREGVRIGQVAVP